jgi:hypothetical protein
MDKERSKTESLRPARRMQAGRTEELCNTLKLQQDCNTAVALHNHMIVTWYKY